MIVDSLPFELVAADRRGRSPRFPLRELGVGQMFFADSADRKRLRSAIGAIRRKNKDFKIQIFDLDDDQCCAINQPVGSLCIKRVG